MNTVRLDWISAGSAGLVIDYGGKRATIEITGLGTTGGPEETGTPWKPFYQARLEELFAAIQAECTIWRDSGK